MADDKASGRSGLGAELRGAVENGVEKLGLDQINFVREALKWQYNWIGLVGAAAFAIVSGTGLPLVLAAGLELIYLSLVPQSSRFRRLVRSWKYAEEKRQNELKLSAMFHELPPEIRNRYADLDKMCRDIRANYERLSSTSQIFVKQMDEKLEELLNSYLRLSHAAYRHREHIQLTNTTAIESELHQLQRTLETNTPRVQEINRKRIEILNKRLEKVEKIRENRQVIDAQCEAIQDVLELIRDQSVTLSDPQQVSDRLENLMRDVEQTEETVRQVEAIFELATPEGPELLSPAATDSPAPRTRVRS